MKNIIRVFAFLILLGSVGMSQAFAVNPTIDGVITGAEWSDMGYPYYLSVSSPNISGGTVFTDIPDQYDLELVVLLQSLGNADPAEDGIYLLIKTYDPMSLVDQDTVSSDDAGVELAGDFEFNNGIDIRLFHFSDDGDPSADSPASDSVRLCIGAAACGPTSGVELTSVVGPLGGVGDFARSTVVEYFIPTGLFSDPGEIFPTAFRGFINFGNGGPSPDDTLVGSLVPEPASMFLLGGGLLGLFGIGGFKKKQ